MPLHKLCQRFSFFKRGEVFALHVLDERDLVGISTRGVIGDFESFMSLPDRRKLLTAAAPLKKLPFRRIAYI